MSDIKPKIKNVIFVGFRISSIHGLTNMVTNTHRPVKILWVLSVLASLAACSYLIVASILSYLQYEVISKMSIISETVSPFPTISICNIVPFVTKSSESFEQSILENSPFKQLLNFTDSNTSSIEPQKYLARYFACINGNTLYDDVKKTYGLTMDEMLLSCMFSSASCTSSDFEWYYDVIYGNCFRFNSGTNASLKTSTNTGKMNGLKLELYVGSANKLEYRHNTGAHIFIHNNTAKPTPYEGFFKIFI